MWSSVTAAGTENGPAPPSRSKHSATLLCGHVYLLGGRNGNLPLKDLWRYSLSKKFNTLKIVHVFDRVLIRLPFLLINIFNLSTCTKFKKKSMLLKLEPIENM